MKLAQRTDGISPVALSARFSGNMKSFMAASTVGGIEAQEKAGQMDQAGKETLPIELGSKHQGTPAEHRKRWEALGFVFGEPADDIFIAVQFPKGWKKVPTSHDMWTDIVDAKGRKRGSIFCKAAFYDRSAHANLSCRFSIGQDYDSPTQRVFINDACGKVERRVDGLEKPDYSKDRAKASENYDKIEAARKELWDWLKTQFPDCDSPLGHWED